VKLFKPIFCILLFGILNFKSISQNKSNPVETITVDELRDHVFFLASDSLQGRFPGTPGYNLAASYAESQFCHAGLEPVCKDSNGNATYFQQVILDKFEIYKDSTELIITIEDTKYPFKVLDHFIMPSGALVGQNEITGQAVFVGYGIHAPDFGWDDYQRIELKDKWAIIINDIPDSIKTKYLAECPKQNLGKIRFTNLQKAGAIGTIVLTPKEFTETRWKTVKNSFNIFYSIPQIKRPVLVMSYLSILTDTTLNRFLFKGQQFDPLELRGKYGSFEMKGMKIELKKEYQHTQIPCKNIVAVVSGTDPVLKNEYITIGAHLDHLGIVGGNVMNGADDNASGCAAIMEIAEAVAYSKPKRSVLFLLHTAEELQSLGSNYFVHNPPIPIENIKVNINLDMIGRPDGVGNDLINIFPGENNLKLKELLYNINNKTTKLVLDSIPHWNINDNYFFALKGNPNIWLSTGSHNEYHTPRDDAEKINYDYLQQVSKLTYEIIMKLANEDISLKN